MKINSQVVVGFFKYYFFYDGAEGFIFGLWGDIFALDKFYYLGYFLCVGGGVDCHGRFCTVLLFFQFSYSLCDLLFILFILLYGVDLGEVCVFGSFKSALFERYELVIVGCFGVLFCLRFLWGDGEGLCSNSLFERFHEA